MSQTISSAPLNGSSEMANDMARRPITGRTVLLSLVGFFGVIFAANAALIWLAVTSWNGVETESAYKDGSSYPREIAAAEAQASRDWHVAADVARSGDGVAIEVDLKDARVRPLSGLEVTARLERPSHDREDVSLTLSEGEVGTYRGRVPHLSSGNWHLVLDAAGNGERLFRSVNKIILE